MVFVYCGIPRCCMDVHQIHRQRVQTYVDRNCLALQRCVSSIACAGAWCSIVSHAYSVAFTRISFISSITNPAQLTEVKMYINFAGMSAVSGDVHMDMEGQERSSRCSSDSGASGHSPSSGSCLLDCSVAANSDDVQPSAGCLHHLGPVLHVGPAQLCCCLLGGWTGSLLRCHPARCSRAHRSAP